MGTREKGRVSTDKTCERYTTILLALLMTVCIIAAIEKGRSP